MTTSLTLKVPYLIPTLSSQNFEKSGLAEVQTMARRAVWKVSGHFEYLENQSYDLDVTWQPVRGDLTVHL